MPNKTDALHEGLKKMLNYLPMIYTQKQTKETFSTDGNGNYVNTGKYIIKYPYESIPNNALLFMLPLQSAIKGKNTLEIQFAKVDQSGSYVDYSTTKTYTIMVEDIDGKKREATRGDIIANRLCMFRFLAKDSSDIILCNNPVYNNLNCSTLSIVNEAKFYSIPKYVHYTQDGATEIEFNLALESDVNELKRKVAALENKFKVGTETAKEYFENNPDAAVGTIYLQTED